MRQVTQNISKDFMLLEAHDKFGEWVFHYTYFLETKNTDIELPKINNE